MKNRVGDPNLPLAFKIAQTFGRPIEEIFFPDGVRVPVRGTGRSLWPRRGTGSP
ncbi:MAG: hypothetical protein QN141_00390 [Armatimonadota bacterium]|nr:hypothetical protein [Armatimonadota bacterium]MDR7465716.1 hypothetical protein [Armatimonadota bacterium]MDR7499127.1 hypothetical protein [Armatimonadota bacterium]MDR7503432.1 hypothetical protein [Armatimonadota bacterium]MDR7552343.1 hypothetical protein [Armatimonadota bacterium]